jgi:translocation and assembly module TamB
MDPRAAPVPPPPPPRSGRPRPLRTSLYLLTPLVWVLLAALATLGAAWVAARWVLLTEEGTAWLLAKLPMVTEARGVQGALLGPSWRIERLRVQWDGGRQGLLIEDLESEGMVWRWRPSAGPVSGTGAPGTTAGLPTLWAALDVESLQVRRLQIETGPTGPRPIPLPANLAPPLRLSLARLAIGELRVDAFEPASEVAASGVVFDGQPGARHRIEQLIGRAYGLHVQAAASLANLRPFELQAQATLAPALLAEADAPPWAAVLNASGPLAAFELQGTLRGRPAAPSKPPAPAAQRARAGAPAADNTVPALDLKAQVRPLQAWPVQRLALTTEALDLAALRVGAPQTRLAGEVLVQAAARNAPVSVQVRVANRLPGRWDERRVPVSRLDADATGELARPDRVELTRFELQLAGRAAAAGVARASTPSAAPAGAAPPVAAVSAGRIDGRAVWSAHQLELEARLHDVRPQHLDGRAPAMALAGPLRLTLGGLPSPDRRSTAAAPPLSLAGQLELEGRVEGALRPVSLRAEGRGTAEGFELRHLQVRSGDAQAVLRLAAQRHAGREWALASEGSLAEFDPNPWWPGDSASPWRQGPHRLNAGWQFELRAPADAAQLAPLALLQRLAGNGRLRLHDSVLAGVPLAGEVTLGYGAAVAGGAASGGASAPGGAGARAAATTSNTASNTGRLRAELQLGGNRVLVEGQGDAAAGGPGAGAGDRWRVEVRAAALATLAPLTRLHPSLAQWVPRQGNVNAEIAAQGRWPRMASQGQVRADDLLVGTLGLTRGQAQWRLDLGEAAAGEAPLAFEGQASGLRLAEQRIDELRVELQGTRAEHRIQLDARLPMAPGTTAARLLNLGGAGRGEGTRAQLLAQGQWRPEPGGGGRWRARIDEIELGSGATGGGPARGTSGAASGAANSAATAAPTSAATSAATGTTGRPAGGTTGIGTGATSTPGTSARSAWADARSLRAELWFDAHGRLLTLSAEPGRVRLADTFTLRWEAVEVDLRRAQADFALRADIDPFELSPLLARLQPSFGWQGDLRLAARVELRAAERFEADLVFARVAGDLHLETQGELQLLGLTDFRLLAKVRDGLWDVEPVFRGRGLGEIRGRLRVRTTPERRWPHDDAAVEGQLQVRVPDIGVWGHWVPPGWRLAGELASTAQLGGRFAEPTYTGELIGKGLAVRNLLQGVNVADGQLRVRLAGSSAQIETFTLRGGDGRVTITGNADLGAQPSARLTLSAERFRVLGRVDRQLTASGQAELALAVETSRLDGRFKVDEGLFDFTRADAPSLDEDVSVRGAEAAEAEAARADAQAGARGRQRFVLGVDVDLGSQLKARGRGVDTGLTGALRITNPGGRLAVRGNIETVQGTYAAYGQKLELERGVIAFSGPLDNPWLDIRALRPNLDIRVGLQVSGPLQGLRVRLFSDPEMSETDKLSWLVLGRPSEGLGRNDTAILQRAAVALLAGEGEAPTDAFMRRLGIDELSLKQSEGDVRETVVSLGKQLSRRWYLGYERSVNATTGTWQLIYRAAQRFTLRAQSGLENSLDLIWTWRLQPPPDEGGVRKSLPAVPP